MNYMKPFFNPIQYISILLLIGFSNIASAHTQAATRNMTYDSALNMTYETDQLGKKTSYEYDANRNIKKISAEISTNVLKTAEFTYNTLGQILTASDALGFILNTYDGRGNLTNSKTADGSNIMLLARKQSLHTTRAGRC